jgi:polar amino acid transport system substrate-binding protein
LVASISEYGAMIPGLQAGRFDLVTAGLFIKKERCDAESFAIKKGNPLGLKSFGDIASSDSARDADDAALAELKASGESAAIVEPFGYSAEAAMQQTRENLCEGPN